MTYNGFTKSDWLLFKERIAGWQEQYMDKLNKEYAEILNENISPSEKFWKLEKRLRNDKRSAGVIVEMRRTNMISNIIGLIRDGAITFDDLADFSDELKHSIKFILDME